MSLAPSNETLSARISERYNSNVQFLKQTMPAIYAIIQKVETNSNLTFNTNTQRLERVDDEGEIYYAGGAVDFAVKEVLDFESKMESSDYRALPWDINPSHLIKKEPFKNTVKSYIKSYVNNTIKIPRDFGLLIFGSGMGYHVEILCNKKNFSHCTVIEPNINRFIESLYCIDWKSILLGLDNGYQLTLIVKDPDITDANFKFILQQQFYRQFPRITASTIIYSHDHDNNHESFKVVRESIKEFNNVSRVSMERAGPDCQRLINFVENVSNYHAIIDLKRSHFSCSETKIAIIGAGPSLDKYIHLIKEHQEKLFIVSAGSSLKSLLANEIYPDIHFELEYLNLATDLLLHTGKNYDLSKIDLICSAEGNPGYLKLFNSARTFVQETSEIASILKPEFILSRGGLTCTNGAAAIMSNLGNNDILFFGLDFAHTFDEHHAENNITNESDLPDNLKELEIGGKLLKTAASTEVKDTRGNTVLTTPALFTARLLMESLCNENENKYYNCSYGAEIKGTEYITENDLGDLLEKSKPKSKDIMYKELKLSPELIKRHTRTTFDTTFSINKQVLTEIERLKELDQKEFCDGITSIVAKILSGFCNNMGQFRNIMGFNRSPLLLLYTAINYAPQEYHQTIIETWMADYSQFIEFTSEIIFSKYEKNDFYVKEDWLEPFKIMEKPS